jgi:hypothetical protein
VCLLQVVLLKGWHINDDEMTRQAISRSNIVVNLIGSTLETRNFSFDDVHAAWPARLAAMAKETPQVGDTAAAAAPAADVGETAVGDLWWEKLLWEPPLLLLVLAVLVVVRGRKTSWMLGVVVADLACVLAAVGTDNRGAHQVEAVLCL